jgi:hypothetical protein
MNIKFRITRFTKELAFQTLEVDATFWAKVVALITTPYTTSQGVVVKIGTVNDISKIRTNNEITLTNTTFSLSTVVLVDESQMETDFGRIVSSVKEFVIYVNNNGSLPQICQYCNNFNDLAINISFCAFIETITVNWDYQIDKCSHFNNSVVGGYKKEVYQF